MPTELRIDFADLPVGSKKQVTEGDAKVLFVRDADGVRAFQATCPHYGAPLEKGEICGNVLYCPWHKAAFDVGSGALIEPPALNGLTRYPVRMEADVAIASMEPVHIDPPAPVKADGHMVIIGTGAAAAAAVTTLRREGFAGRITMVGSEEEAPYDRTKLSKAFLAKPTPPEAMLLDKDFDARHRVERVRAEATHVALDLRYVVLADGRTIAGDAILVATGSRAVPPDVPGAGLDGVYGLRSLSEATAISRAAGDAKQVVVVGGGFIGLEAAAFLTKRGLSVTVAAQEALPFAKRFGEAVATGLKRYHEGAGVRFVQGTVARLEGGDHVDAVVMEDGTRLPAQLVVFGIGAAPNSEILADANLREDGGVTVGADLAVAPGVFVAGDIAAFPGRGGEPVRIEHWRLAQQHGMHAARGMLGHDEPFRRAPFFWSNQGDKRLDYGGHATDWDEIVMRGDPATLDFIAYYVKGDEAVAACSIGRNAAFTRFLARLDAGESVRTGSL